LNYLPLKSLIRPRRNNVSKNWKSCEGQNLSEGSNPSHCAKQKHPNPLDFGCFCFAVSRERDTLNLGKNGGCSAMRSTIAVRKCL